MTHSHSTKDNQNHSHGHDHHHAPQSFNKAFAIAVGLNLTFMLFQASYALIAGSMSLLADAAHNFGDVFGLILAWGANWLLTLPASERYSYGFKRTTIIAALTNALILVATSAIIAYESIHKLLHITSVNESIVIIVATIGIFINGGTALLFMKGAHDDLNIKGAFLHLLGDALISIGVVIGGILILYTKQAWLDPLIGLLIITIILWSTFGLLRNSVSLILDAVPHNIKFNSVQDYLHSIPGVTAIHDLHIWSLSTKEIALTAHLVMPADALSDETYKQINRVLKQKFNIDHATIQVEKGSVDFVCQRTDSC
jgi:cobalt-zinc-cadmium efflux system protein